MPACGVGAAVIVGRATSRACCLPLTSTISRGGPLAGVDSRRDRGSLAHVRSSLPKRPVCRSTRGTTLRVDRHRNLLDQRGTVAAGRKGRGRGVELPRDRAKDKEHALTALEAANFS